MVHPDVPIVPNVGYLVAGRLFHPGDAFTLPGQAVEVLAVPAAAPFLKLAESIDYLREVGPRVAVPIHEKVLSEVGVGLHYRQLETLGARGSTTFRVLDDGNPRWTCSSSRQAWARRAASTQPWARSPARRCSRLGTPSG
jgi:hypothetical protein